MIGSFGKPIYKNAIYFYNKSIRHKWWYWFSINIDLISIDCSSLKGTCALSETRGFDKCMAEKERSMHMIRVKCLDLGTKI